MLHLVNSNLMLFNSRDTSPHQRNGHLEWDSWDNWGHLRESDSALSRRNRYRCISVKRREDQLSVTFVVSKTHDSLGFGSYELSLIQPKRGKDPAKLTLKSETDGFEREFWFALSEIEPDGVTWTRTETEAGDHLVVVVPKATTKSKVDAITKGSKRLPPKFSGHDYLGLSRKQNKAMQQCEFFVAVERKCAAEERLSMSELASENEGETAAIQRNDSSNNREGEEVVVLN